MNRRRKRPDLFYIVFGNRHPVCVCGRKVCNSAMLAGSPEERRANLPRWFLIMSPQNYYSAGPNVCVPSLQISTLCFVWASRQLLTVGLTQLEGVVFLDNQDRKMIITRSGGMRPLLLADCHVPPDRRFTFYDQVHTTGRCDPFSSCAETVWKTVPRMMVMNRLNFLMSLA